MPITLENSILSQYNINELFSEHDYLNDYEYDVFLSLTIKDFSDGYFICSFSLSYQENDFKHFINHKKITINKENFSNSFKSYLNILIYEFEKQKTCNHIFEHEKDLFNTDFPDGRAVCKLCLKKHPSFFKPNINNQIAKGINLEYVTQFDWANTYLQCGKSGIVISKDKPYKTAFFEAFPQVGEFSTFIRGEGDNLKDAEYQCWEKFQKQLNCKSHKFTRTVKGKDRVDGSGICLHCNLFSTKALEPLTKCCICNTPTNDATYESKKYCYHDFFQINIDDYIKSLKLENENFDQSDILNFYYEFYIEKFIFNNYGYDFFIKNKNKIFQIYCCLSNYLLKDKFNIKPFSEITNNFPDYNNPVFFSGVEFLLKNINEILDFKTFKDINSFFKLNI